MLRQTLKKIIKGQKGQALPIVLILLLIGGLLIVPTLNYASTSLKGHEVVESNTLEFYSADSGIEDALYWLIKGKPEGSWDWNEGGFWERQIYYLNAKSVNVTVEEIDINEYKIVSIATGADGSTTVLSTVWAAAEPLGDLGDLGHGEWDGDAYIDGDGVLFGTVTGDVYVTGTLELKSQSQIGRNVYVGGDFTLKHPSTIVHGNVCCHGNMRIKGHVNGDIYMTVDGSHTIEVWGTTGDIYVDGTGSVTIILHAQADVGDIYITEGVACDGAACDRGQVWDGQNPPPPDCSDIPVGGGDIYTYEIL